MKKRWFLSFPKRKTKLSEAERSFSDRTRLLCDALCDSELCPHEEGMYCGCSVMDVFDTYMIYRTGYDSSAYRVDYTIADDGSVTLGTTPVEVLPTMTYPDAPAEPGEGDGMMERGELLTDCVPLKEAALSEAATAQIKLIAPGWGSSGYYSKETLRKAAPVFSKGTKMFWNHQTAAEEASRPEGDLNNLAGELLEDATYREDGSAGPGLYAKARVFDRFKDAVRDLKDSIGVSIRAYGKAETGEAEGRKGPCIKEITAAKSVDYVTVPGAGGKALELFESAGRVSAKSERVKENSMNEEQIKALMEARVKPLEAQIASLTTENAALKTDAARLREAMALNTARDFAVKRLATINLPVPTRARLAESLALNPPTNANGLDVEAFAKQIDEAAKREAEYLASLGGGVVRGLGAVQESSAVEVKEADLVASFVALGMSESAAKIAAGGRN